LPRLLPNPLSLNRFLVLVPLLNALPLQPRDQEHLSAVLELLLRAESLSTMVPSPSPLPKECNRPLNEPKVPPREAKLPPLVSDLHLRDQEHP